MRRAGVGLVVVLFAAAMGAGLWWLSAPDPMAAGDLPAHIPDVNNGRIVFHASGCGSCHATPGQSDMYRLGGGWAAETPFGTFHAPNISPDVREGIGSWTPVQFVNAVTRGISPEGTHYYPAFPYASYAGMRVEDALDLFAFIKTLPEEKTPSLGHNVSFPYNIRRGIGFWKWRYVDRAAAVKRASVSRGAYLVEALGHCAECHSPRDALGGVREDYRFAGGDALTGESGAPNITPHPDGLADWNEDDLAYMLADGFTPDGDSLGGSMAPVIGNLAELSDEDRRAIASYLLHLPERASITKR